VDHQKVLKLKAEAAPFVDRLLRMDDLLPYQATADAPGDSPTQERDHDVKCPFQAARKGVLTTFKVIRWIPSYRKDEVVKVNKAGSSKAAGGEEGVVDGQ
jgi:hypothetical protein